MTTPDDTAKLSSLLKIPISEVEYTSYFCELKLDQNTIGYIPIKVSDDVIQYETSSQFLNKLDWNKIYSLQKKSIDQQIESHLTVTSFQVLPISFRRLYVEDEQGNLIASFRCSYHNNEWEVEDEQFLHRDTQSTSDF